MDSLTLVTQGYKVQLLIHSIQLGRGLDDTLLSLSVAFVSQAGATQLAIKTKPFLMYAKDIQRLKQYFLDHIATLQHIPDASAYPFVTYELAFQVSALPGQIWKNDLGALEGDFTLRWMVNADLQSQDRTYLGGESTVTYQSVFEFIQQLDALLAKCRLQL